MCNSVSRTITLPTFLHALPHACSSASSGALLSRLAALAISLLLVPLTQGNLSAQQLPDDGQYAPESSYDQPDYRQPQPYGRQAYPDPGATDLQQDFGQVQPLNAQDLEQLVAPIALYPDALVAQVLAASTYPEQVADADRWRQAQGYAPPDQIAAGADAQPWDPSVKALTAFPRVLAQMDQNLHWTSDLGNAYYNQPQDVLEAVQEMRQRARAAGNLQSTPQQAMSYDQGNIALAPADPQVVYVPSYDPWGVYGEPVSPYPGFSALDAVGSFFASAFGSSALRFGAGVAISAFTQAPWGWLGWGLNWLTQSVLFNNSDYFSHSSTVADWGLARGGRRGFSRGGTFAMRSNGSYRTFGNHGRSNGEYGRAGSQAFARTRNEDAYARNRSGDSRGYQTFGVHYGRSSREFENRFQPAVARSQQYRSERNGAPQSRSQYASRGYGSSGYGSNFYGRSAENHGGRAAASGYGSSMRADRGPRANFQRSEFGKQSSRGFKNSDFAKSSGKRDHSGGFHFGGGHAPKGSGGGKSFHAHSGGGGHSGGHGHSGGGKHHHG